jgi:DNA-directed RNA polymerase sigma subunit (sigma70/sigma32)
MNAKKQAFDEGLKLLYAMRQPGRCYGYREIGRWCGVSGEAIRQAERRILRKVRARMSEAIREGL